MWKYDQSDVEFVERFDEWVVNTNQDDLLDELDIIFEAAHGSYYGWAGVAKEDPKRFHLAFILAMSNIHRMEG